MEEILVARWPKKICDSVEIVKKKQSRHGQRFNRDIEATLVKTWSKN